MQNSLKWAVALLLLNACQIQSAPTTQLSSPTANSLNLVSAKLALPASVISYPALKKTAASGELTVTGNQVHLTLDLYPKVEGEFQAQKLDLAGDGVDTIHATLTDSHGKTYTVSKSYSGGAINLTFNDVTPNPLLIAEVEARNGASVIPQTQLATALAYSGTVAPPAASINFQTTVAAKALKSLIDGSPADKAQARVISLTDLKNLTAAITGVTGSGTNTTYDHNHPSLVNINALTTSLKIGLPADLMATASSYRQTGATLPIKVTGLTGGDTIDVQITDAASAIKTGVGLGTRSISGATPGNGLRVKVAGSSQAYTYSVPATINLIAGVNPELEIVATPTLQIDSISPTSGPPGTIVTITGKGFTDASGVSHSNAPALYTIDSDTQITATVPLAAIDGPITVSKGAVSKNSASFDAHRFIFVKADATGAGHGRSWADAYPSLTAAIGAAAANDQIWVAKGTYKPVDKTSSFYVKADVKIYGGFAGGETSLIARNPATNLVTLSGDLDNDDNSYPAVPFTTDGDNVDVIVQIPSNGTLDGFTVQGASVSAIYASGRHTPTLNNLIIKNNNSDRTDPHGRGAGLFLSNESNPKLSNIVFSENFASKFGGALYALGSSSPALMKKIVFTGNKADEGAAMYIGDTGEHSLTLEQVIMTGNTSRKNNFYVNLYNGSQTPITLTLKNVLFANNDTLEDSGFWVLGDPYGDFAAYNVTFANNKKIGDGFSDVKLDLPGVYTNTLIWKNTLKNPTPVSGGGNIDLASGGTPFLNSANPKGLDGVWFTTDDGFNFVDDTINGVDNGVSGGSIPAHDITGRPRQGDTDAGAYEYITP